MSANPTVSIIMPVYNGERTIVSSIRSILEQSLQNLELIVLNDGSTDQTAELVASFKDSRVRLVSFRDKAGIVVRLNQGIDLARGEFIARMDCDDIAHPERLARQVLFLRNNENIGLVGARTFFFSSDMRVLGYLRFEQNHREILRNRWMGFSLAHPSWCGRSKVFKEVRYRNFPYAEDQDFLFRASRLIKFASLPETLLFYRLSSPSLKKSLRYRLGLCQVVYVHLGVITAIANICKGFIAMMLKQISVRFPSRVASYADNVNMILRFDQNRRA